MRQHDARHVPADDGRDAEVPDQRDRDPVELRREAHERVDQQRRQPDRSLDDEREVVGDEVAGRDRQERGGVDAGWRHRRGADAAGQPEDRAECGQEGRHHEREGHGIDEQERGEGDAEGAGDGRQEPSEERGAKGRFAQAVVGDARKDEDDECGVRPAGARDVGEADDPGTQDRVALAVLRCCRALRAVDAALGTAYLAAAFAQRGTDGSAADRADVSEPCQLHLEQLGIAQPGDLAEGDHASQRQHRVRREEQPDGERRVAGGEDQLGPHAGGEERHGRPARQSRRVGDAQVDAACPEALRQPFDSGEGRPERAERRPGVADEGGDDREADPDADPEQHTRQRRDVADHEGDDDRAVPPRQPDDAQDRARGSGQRIGHRMRRVRPAARSRDERGDDERRPDGNRRTEQVQPQGHRKLEGAADGVRRHDARAQRQAGRRERSGSQPLATGHGP